MAAKNTGSRKKTTRKKSAKAKSSTRPRKTTSRKKTRKYGAGASKKVKRAMDEMKDGKLRSGRSGNESNQQEAGYCDRLERG